MEKAVGRQQQRKKALKIPALTKMQLATQTEDIRPTQPTKPTKMQFASKAAKKEDYDIRPKLAPLHNKGNRCTNIPSRLPSTKPLALTKPPSMLHSKAPSVLHPKPPALPSQAADTEYSKPPALPSRAADTEGDEQNQGKPTKKELQHTTEVDGMVVSQAPIGKSNNQDETSRAKGTSSQEEGGTRTTQLPTPNIDWKQPDGGAVVCRMVALNHQQLKYRDFHELTPDHVTDLDSLPQLGSSTELKDPQQCTEYVNDIYENMLVAEREPIYRTTPSVLTRQSEVKENHRRVLVDWLIQVHTKFGLLPDTLHVCIDIMDRYLQVQCFQVA